MDMVLIVSELGRGRVKEAEEEMTGRSWPGALCFPRHGEPLG